jgi:4-hydroxy-tetrahydrodipicolinate reductase
VLKAAGTDTEITSHRTGDAVGIHEVVATSAEDSIVLRHEAFSRRGFALGAVRGAEWLAERNGIYDYRDVFAQM